jgi:cold shock protein
MPTGKVKWFNDKKGYGFIEPEGGGEDIFVHHTSIEADGYRTLAEGQQVKFEVVHGPKGQQATNVNRLN